MYLFENTPLLFFIFTLFEVTRPVESLTFWVDLIVSWCFVTSSLPVALPVNWKFELMSSYSVLSHPVSPGPLWQVVSLVHAKFGGLASGVSIVRGCIPL